MHKKRISKNSPRAQNAVFDIHPGKGPLWNSPRKIVSLRRHLYRRHPILTSVGALAVVLATIFAADTFLGHANSVYWYPQSCLGGWTNPANAAGAPELTPLSEADEFNADNSAILDNSISKIFCGSFGGPIPEDSSPTSVTLNISLAFKMIPGSGAISQTSLPEVAGESSSIPEEPALEQSSDSVDTPEVGTSTEAILEPDSGQSSDIETPPEPEEEPVPESESNPVSEPEPEPEPENIPAAEPELAPSDVQESSFLNIFRRAFAQEAAEIVEDAPVENAPLEDVPVENVTTGTIVENAVQDNAGEFSDTSSTEESVPVEREILKVRYSIDGRFWFTLGRITESSWRDTRFEIPITSWGDLENLQISVASLPVSDMAPVVYLDGLSLAVDYGPAGTMIVEEGLVAEKPPVVPEPPIPPPIDERKVLEISEVDENAEHGCGVEPFRVDVSGLSSATAAVKLIRGGYGQETVGIGYLPEGIEVTFLNKGEYVHRPGPGEVSLELEIKNGAGSQKGDFNIPIIYTRKGSKNSSVVCQLNIVNR